jgi:uncharacterized GH25 family protein
MTRVNTARLITALFGVLVATAALGAHDLLFRLDNYFVEPGARVTVPVFNGTFVKSENAVARNRLGDLSLVGPQGRQAIDKQNWTEVEPQSTVTFTVGGTGTYVVGVAVQPRMISMDAAEFNAYLKEDGIDQALADRTAKGKLNEPAKERYSKYVKALVQVGPSRTNSFSTVLGHQAEIVPVENPFAMTVGGTLAVRALVMGKPLPRYAVFAGGRSGEGDIPVQRLMTDEQGIARVRLTHPGAWYVKFIHMEEVTDGSATHESRWATLSFGVR